MKNKILLSAVIISLCTFSTQVYGQLKVSAEGNVGIKLGAATPLSALSIGNIGIGNARVYIYGSGQYSVGSGDQYGIYSRLSYGPTSGCKYAIYGISQVFNGSVVGVKGEASPLAPATTRNVSTIGVY